MCKGAKSAISFLCLFILVSLSLFSAWNVGDFVDDFEDPTGEHFLFTAVYGTYKKSEAKKSTSRLRVLFCLVDGTFPKPVIVFEPHTYGWDVPFDDFYDNSTAIIKIKDDAGIVYSYHTKNTVLEHSWNRLTGKDALGVVGLLKNNNTLKIYIEIESYTFNYTVDCSDFEMLYQDFKPKTDLEANKWELSPFYDDLWSASIFLDSEDQQFGVDFKVWVNPTSDDYFPSLWGHLYYKDLDMGLFASADLDEVDRISFSTENCSYSSSFDWAGLISTAEFDWYEFYRVLEKEGDLKINVYMTTGEIMSFKTSASEFLKYTRYPYGFAI